MRHCFKKILSIFILFAMQQQNKVIFYNIWRRKVRIM